MRSPINLFFASLLLLPINFPTNSSGLINQSQSVCISFVSEQSGQVLAKAQLAKTEFEIIEGRFHDGLGTYAELSLANALIDEAKIFQSHFDTSTSHNKMMRALTELPETHPGKIIFSNEIANIEKATRRGAIEILSRTQGKLQRVVHTAREYADAKAGDLRLEFADHRAIPISVKTDKSNKVAVAEGQTPDIWAKWANRYFRVSESEWQAMMMELGFASASELKAHYLNVSQIVALIMIRKLELNNCEMNNFSRAKVGNIEAAKYLFRQLLHYKKGNDNSRVIIFDRTTGEVKWESVLDELEIDSLTNERISFRPSRPKKGHSIASEFGIKIDGRVVVTFQIKHRRGAARNTEHKLEFSDITTRLQVARL